MTYTHLRALMKRLSPATDHTLKNCDLVIDGRSYFKDSYKKSGCQSLFGGEYDRYADYLRSTLKPFLESNITCYVIFNGGMEASLERRKEIHEKVIDNVSKIDPDDKDAYCEPIFAKDVWKQVLDELNIKYYVTEHDSWNTMFWVAEKFKCPILTKNYELSLRFVNCISPKSLMFNKNDKEIACKIFESENIRSKFRLKHKLLPLFLTLVDESSAYFKKLPVIVDCSKPKYIMGKVLRWVRWQTDVLEETLQKIREILTEEEAEEFFNVYQKNEELCRRSKNSAAVRHFKQDKKIGNSKIPIPYINLICSGIFSGSWVVFDEDQEDAMLPALDIIFYACKCMKFKKEAMITFVGRDGNVACAWNVDNSWDEIDVNNVDLFKNFIIEKLPGFDFKHLEAVSEECWILIITLVYYYNKKHDLNFAYSIILSYVMMGPVSENVGLIKRSNFICPEERSNDVDKNGLKTNDCVSIIESMMDLFYVKNAKRLFDRKILHTFAEFQHCLQHMNYLNNLCGKKIEPTIFHKTINATFAYNIFIKTKDVKDLNKYFEKRLKRSTVYDYFKRTVVVFNDCLQSVGIGV
ncbi:hypothetical protein NE865_10717 [Phthorimaea operculella]|nr:hypothetical protein NE865_10717 [Phthorimaea operculella]